MKSALILIMSLLVASHALAEDNVAKGQRLFAQSSCLNCHGTDVFTRKDRKVHNLQQLEKQVRACDSNLSVNWFDDEIKAVVAYLNHTYYKFSPKQSGLVDGNQKLVSNDNENVKKESHVVTLNTP